MNIKDLLKFLLAVLMLGTTIALAAIDPVNDDTDIFLANPTYPAERPNVLIVLDNTANWNTPFDNEKAALVQVVNSLSDQFNLGLMMFPETGGANDTVDGGYVRFHVRQTTLQNRTALASLLNNLDKLGDKGNNATTGLALHEAYLYFAGKTSIASHGKVKTDKAGTTDAILSTLPDTVASRANRALPSGTSPALYNSPVSDGCQRNFVIYISNGPANENAEARADLEAKLGTLTGVNPPAVISLTPDGQQSNWADEMAKFMANADVYATSGTTPNSGAVQNVYTYTIEIDPAAGANIITVTTSTPHGFAVNDPVTISGTTNYNGGYTVNSVISTTQFNIVATIVPAPAPEIAGDVSGKTITSITQTASDMTALLKSMAANGKGKYFAVSSAAAASTLVDALNSILIEVQAVNSVFASTTLPVSVNVRGTNLNQVYIGVFRPDQTKAPRWLGNLKMYNLALNSATGTVYLADAANDPPPHASPPQTGNAAENSSTGFVSQNSPSFWTESSTFWGFRHASLNGPGGASDLPDGDLVEKGGAAQQLRKVFAGAEAASPARNLYTCTSGLVNGVSQSCLPNVGFALSNTPFSTLNEAIDAGSLQLESRLVSPLTAYFPKSVVSVTDRLPLWSFTNTWSGYYVNSLDNGSTTVQLSSLTTATPKVISTLTGQVANAQVVSISSVSKVSGNFRFQASSALPSNFTANASVVISGTSNSVFHGTWTISAVDNANNRFTISGGPSGGNPSATGGTATVTAGTISSTTAQATLAGHGYVSGQPVTIAGATPSQFNGTFNITRIDNDRFTFTIPTAAGNAAVASGYTAITAAGNTTTATATTSVPLPGSFTVGSTVNISGASDAAYNGAKTILSLPSATSFTYSVGATAVGPNTNTVGVSAAQGGSTTVTVTIAGTHFLSDGQSLSISGSDVAGYNGTFTISCASCDPILGSTATFTYQTASILPANNSFNVFVSEFVSDFILAYAPHHGLKEGDQITIEGPAPFAGNYEVYYTFGSDYYFYVYAPSLAGLCNPTCPAVTQTGYTVRPIGGTNGVTGGPATGPLAYVTLTNHGYPNGQEVRIDGASPTGYNGIKNIRVCQDGEAMTYRHGGTLPIFCGGYQLDRFNFPLTSALGVNTSNAVTSSIQSTTARATSINHGFVTGSTITVAGATPGAFNGGPYVVTKIDNDTFTYSIGSLQGDATGAITAAQSGGFSAERNLLIRWVRGEDNASDENSNSSTSDIRASVHGDVLHSRPAVINYNRYAGSDDDVFVYYGGNDGVFHAIKGGYGVPTGDASGLTPGREAWGFIPQEFFSQFNRLRNNSPSISSFFKKPYFMDGPIGIYTKDGDVPADGKLGGANDTVNLYIANRRGGRFLYALDVNNPTNPKYLWKIDSTTPGFSELGQTWSQPSVISNLAGLSVPLLVFGAGYDPAIEDLDPAVITSVNNTDSTVSGVGAGGVDTTTVGVVNRTMGRGIFVVNALTGALIWSAGPIGSGATKEVAGMNYAIPSDVTVIRNESGGSVNRAYVGDTGGNMWRIDFRSDGALASPNLALTTVTKLASIADQSTAAGRRKFLFPPDVVAQPEGFDAVLIGTGDREHPFDTTVTNRFYMFKDKGPDTGAVTGATACDPTITEGSIANASCTPDPIAGLTDLTSNCLQDASACTGGETQATVQNNLALGRGWYITLGGGEKVVGNAISLAGTTFFNTNQPSATAGGGTCGSNLGVARQYQVATADATATSDLNAVGGLTGADRSLVHAGGGYLPSPVHVVVMLGGKPVEAVISGIQVSTPAGASLSARLRKFWYKEVDPK